MVQSSLFNTIIAEARRTATANGW